MSKKERTHWSLLSVEELKDRLLTDPDSVILSELKRSATKAEIAAYQKDYRKTHQVRLQAHKLNEARKAKVEGIKEYGSKCSCCGETMIEFLTIDHINGRDKSIPRATGQHEWLRLKWAGWPKDDIQLLCYNCNCAKGVYGSCPHTWKEES